MNSRTGSYNLPTDRPPDTKLSPEFPRTKCSLWDKTGTGPSTFLNISYYRKPKLCIPEKILRLIQHQCENYGQRRHALIGTLVVEDDGEGIQLQVDRLDTRQPSSSGSTDLVPGDLLIPLEVTNNAAKDRACSVEEYALALKQLQERCNDKAAIDLCSFMLLRGWGSFYSNTHTSVVHLDFDMVTLGTVFKATPITPVPIFLTALSKNLAGPMSISHMQGTPKTGYLTMDHTRKLLLVLESDPKTGTLPIIGIWVSGAEFIQHPFVWAACLRYIHNSHLQDRVCHPPEEFLIVLYTPLHSHPEFYQCTTTTGNSDYEFQLQSGHEVTNLNKSLSSQCDDFTEIEMAPADGGPKMETFDAGKAQYGLQVSQAETNLRWKSMPEDIEPRAAPTPHMEKVPTFQPSVPDVSILWTEPSENPKASPFTQSHLGHHHMPSNFATNNPHPNISSRAQGRPLLSQHYLPQSLMHGQAMQMSTPYQHPSPAQMAGVSHHVRHISPGPHVSFQGLSSSPSVASPHLGPTRPYLYSQNSTPTSTYPLARQSTQFAPSVSINQRAMVPSQPRQAQPHIRPVNHTSSEHQLSQRPHTNSSVPNTSLAASNTSLNRQQVPYQYNSSAFQQKQKREPQQGKIMHQSPAMNMIFTPAPVHSGNGETISMNMNVPKEGKDNNITTHSSPVTVTSQYGGFKQNYIGSNLPPQSLHTQDCCAPITFLKTVVEEPSPSTSSSSSASDKHGGHQLQRLALNKNLSGSRAEVPSSNTTENSGIAQSSSSSGDRSSDDDSGLSVSPVAPNMCPQNQLVSSASGAFPASSSGMVQSGASGNLSSSLAPSIDNVKWDNVPPEIRSLLIQQNEQLKLLQQQIQILLHNQSQQSLQSAQTSPAPQSNSRNSNMCSVAVNTSLFGDDAQGVKASSNGQERKSVQTSPVKPVSTQVSSVSPLLQNEFVSCVTTHGDSAQQENDQNTTSNNCYTCTDDRRLVPVTAEQNQLANTSQPNQHTMQTYEDDSNQHDLSAAMADIPAYDQTMNTAVSELMVDMPDYVSSLTDRSQSPTSASDFYGNDQDDSYSTVAEDATDPKQYYSQLMNNIQMFLTNDGSCDTEPSINIVHSEMTFQEGSPKPFDSSSTALAPQINYISMVLGCGAETGQSMEINAMAMKYLNDEQLTQMAKLRQVGAANSQQPKYTTKILEKVIRGQHNLNSKSSTPNLSAVGMSPNDMTMGTQRYLEKHGLLGNDTSVLTSYGNDDLSILNGMYKLKTDFSMAATANDSTNVSMIGRTKETVQSTPAPSPIVKEKVTSVQQGINSSSAPANDENWVPTKLKASVVPKDLGASPVLRSPLHYKKGQRQKEYGAEKNGGDGRNVLREVKPKVFYRERQEDKQRSIEDEEEEEEEENLLDIARLKQMPKLL